MQKNNIKKYWLPILIHVIVWVLFLSLPYLLRPEHNPANQMPRMKPPYKPMGGDLMQYSGLLTNLLMIPIFYVNLYLFFPKLVLKKKYGLFALSQIGLLCSVYLFKELVFFLLADTHARHFGPKWFDIFPTFTYLLVSLAAITLALIRENMRKEREQQERENETLKSELTFLRWQISPHFLFNVLNSFVALTRKGQTEKLESLLIRLSTLIRYMLYESDGEKIPIQKEAEYLLSYIELQGVRTGDSVDIEVDIDIPEDKNYSIEPMLLIPFVENAFKHGVGLVRSPYIKVKLNLNGSKLFFVVMNKKPEGVEDVKDKTSGIGILNVKRRLELLYPGKHILKINDLEDSYYIALQIELL